MDVTLRRLVYKVGGNAHQESSCPVKLIPGYGDMRSTSGATLADLLMASIVACHFPTCISRGETWLGFEWAVTRTEDECANIVPATRLEMLLYGKRERQPSQPTSLRACLPYIVCQKISRWSTKGVFKEDRYASNAPVPASPHWPRLRSSWINP